MRKTRSLDPKRIEAIQGTTSGRCLKGPWRVLRGDSVVQVLTHCHNIASEVEVLLQ